MRYRLLLAVTGSAEAFVEAETEDDAEKLFWDDAWDPERHDLDFVLEGVERV